MPFPVLHTISLAEFESLIADEPDEVAAAFNREGRLTIAPRRGTPISVRFFPEEADRLRNAIVTHVHPLGGPFSGADALFAADHDVSEMRIVLALGIVYSLIRPAEGWPERRTLKAAAERCLETIDAEAARRKREGRPAISEKEYARIAFDDQRDAFGEIGVSIGRERRQ